MLNARYARRQSHHARPVAAAADASCVGCWQPTAWRRPEHEHGAPGAGCPDAPAPLRALLRCTVHRHRQPAACCTCCHSYCAATLTLRLLSLTLICPNSLFPTPSRIALSRCPRSNDWPNLSPSRVQFSSTSSAPTIEYHSPLYLLLTPRTPRVATHLSAEHAASTRGRRQTGLRRFHPPWMQKDGRRTH